MSIHRLASHSFILRSIAALVSYLFIVVMARIMATEDFGIIATILACNLLFATIGCLGQQIALVRFIPPLVQEKDGGAVESQLRASFRLALIGNTAIYFLILAGILIGWLLGRIETPSLLAIGLFIVPLTAWIDMQSYLARAYNSLTLALAPKDVFWRLGILLILVPIYFLTTERISLVVAIVVMLAVMSGLIFAQWKLMQRKLKIPAHPFAKISDAADISDKWRASITPFALSSASTYVLSNLDVILVSLIFGPVEAAIYYGANRFAQLVFFFEQSVAVVIGPNISSSYACKNFNRIQEIVSVGVILTSIPTVVLGLAFIAVPELFLGFMGVSFQDGAGALRILSAAGIFGALIGPGAILLNMCDLERQTMRIGIFSTILFIPLMTFLGVLFGKEGVAFAVLISVVMQKIYFHAVARSALGVRIDAIMGVSIIRKKLMYKLTTTENSGDQNEN
ncbi:oligosaccharide flippase family protein [Celeribacter halophilus]|uniref:Oligosaccharide flippase family protein n=1 Tax=Celeribacter halophilus TaxID=576117 RepID=A0AAW7XVX5_9RHOB|nr:oligosaccharide flippase family protein [Celeribacter halophilus]MDO6458429.1 oligosaccharide flippase family protein [Celeribacter halophilus]